MPAEKSFDELRDDFRLKRFREEGIRTGHRILFGDGTLWFDQAYPHMQGASFFIPILFLSFVFSLLAVAVVIHDGHSSAPYVVLGSLVLLVLLVVTVRKSGKQERELRARLALGLFLRSAEVVIFDETGFKRSIARDDIEELVTRSSFRSGSQSTSFIHLMLSGGDEVHTEMSPTKANQAVLQTWLEGAHGAED